MSRPHKVLPAEAIAMLQRAAQTPVTPANPLARVKAIEAANRRIKRDYPTYFQEELNHEGEGISRDA